MRNEQYIDLNEMGFNTYLEHAVEVLETYEKFSKADFEKYFLKASISKRHIRTHLELMRRMRQCIKNQMDDLDEDEYILISKEELARLKAK